MSVLTSCQAIKYVPAEVSNTEILKNLIPEAPEIPPLPSLNWTYESGRYTLSEQDADKLLDYFEVQIPTFSVKFDSYIKQMNVIITNL